MSMLMFSLGMSLGFPTIAIPMLRGKHPDEKIRFSAIESSWFGKILEINKDRLGNIQIKRFVLGSLIFLTEPLGSIFSGFITEQIGRKRSMLLASVPPILAWAIFYFAYSTVHLFVAGVLLGLGTGLLGAPIYTYCGEIT